MMRGVRLLSFALLALAVGCRVDCSPRDGGGRANVVLVTIDTLRADHVGCYGSTTVRTPHLDRLAAEGVQFVEARAQAPVTVPSHLSILSSLSLAEHGVLHNAGTPPRPVAILPGLFVEAGYRTAAFVSAKHLGPEGPLASLFHGLERYSAPQQISVPFRAAETNTRFFRWLRGACRQPFFAWLHYWDPHMPYVPPAPYDRAYYAGDPRDPRHGGAIDPPLGWFLYDLGGVRALLKQHAGDVRDLKRELGLSSRGVRRLVIHRAGLDGRGSDPGLRARVADLGGAIRRGLPYRRDLADWLTGVRDPRFPASQYAGEVSYVDQEIGALRAEIERLGLASRTILLVTADHGESLGEHGVWFDHAGLYEQSLRVPLIVWAPGHVSAARRTDPATGLDVAPTLLRLAGLDVPPAMRGRDLFGPAPAAGAVVAEGARATQAMLIDGRWKLIRTLQTFYYTDAFARDAGTLELYDVRSDREERDDVAAREPAVVARLAAALEAWREAHATPAPVVPASIPPERVRDLRALGYAE